MAKEQIASNQLAVIDETAFPFLQAIMANPNIDLPALIQENLGDEDFSPFDLDRITVPGAGGTMWEVPTMDGEKNEAAFEGIVLCVQKSRAYWEKEMDGEGTPPDCESKDGLVGHGIPGGVCSQCPLNKFDSGKNGSKACKEVKNIFLLTKDSMLPVIVQFPPTSLKTWKKYAVKLMGQGFRSIHGVVTQFSLEKTKSRSGFTHSKIVCKAVADLTKEQQANVVSFRKGLECALLSAPVAQPTAERVVNEGYDEAPDFSK